MKRTYTLLILLFASFLSFNAYAQNIISAPVNPEYVDYLKNKEAGKISTLTAEGFGLGYIPSPLHLDFSAYTPTKSDISDPSYDLRNAGPGGTSLLTSVKNQGNCGSCWAFAALGAIESRWKILGYGDHDLSEENMNNCHRFEWAPCNGGNLQIASTYLIRKSGPMSEADAIYTGTAAPCPTGLNEQAYVHHARFLPNDDNTIKQALIDYGALYTVMHWDSTVYNSSNFTYYYSGATNSNHAVLLVGWDDNKVTAGGTGAWIIRNSWGNWGESGFFYISYNDTKVNTSVGYFPSRVDYSPVSHVYYYDTLGAISSIGYGTDSAYAAIKFTANNHHEITKIGTYLSASNATVDINVYESFNGSSFSTLITSLTSQSCGLPGYYTFDLDSGFTVTDGDDFYIVVKYKTPSYNFPIPYEAAVSGYADPLIQTGKCWISGNNSSWLAIGTGASYLYDLSIKAYAVIPDLIVDNTNHTISSDITYNDITIDPSGQLTITSGNTLSVLGNFTIKSDDSGTGSFIENGTLDVTGDITVQKYLPNTTSTGWNLSVPVNNADETVFTSADNIYYYDASVPGWETHSSGALNQMTGYVVRFPLTTTIEFEGTLNSGTVSRSNLIRTVTPNNYGWNFIGNPYPSPIDWDANPGISLTNINSAIYYRKADGNVASWVRGTPGVGTNGGTNIVPAMQAFWVQVTLGEASGTVEITNEARIHGQNDIYKSNYNNILRLNISDGQHEDETLIRFFEHATSSFDRTYDAYKMFSNNPILPQLYTTDINNNNYSINSVSEPNNALIVPLTIKVAESGNFSINATGMHTFDTNTGIILEDIGAGIITDLKQNNSYNFTAVSGSVSDRFLVHFNMNATVINNQKENELHIYSFKNTVYIANVTENNSIAKIYDILGREVFSQALEPNVLNKLSANWSSGQYVVSVTGSSQSVSEKLFIR